MDSRDVSGKPEEIKRDIEDTRAALSDKLGKLEHEVRDTVSDAKGVVTDNFDQAKTLVKDNIDHVKGVVGDKIQHVKDSVSLHHHVNERPLTMFAGAVVCGMAIGHMLTRSGYKAAISEGSHHHQTLAERLVPMFDSEIKMLKGAAFSTLIAMLRDVASETVKPALSEFVDGAMQKVAGSKQAVTANGRS